MSKRRRTPEEVLGDLDRSAAVAPSAAEVREALREALGRLTDAEEALEEARRYMTAHVQHRSEQPMLDAYLKYQEKHGATWQTTRDWHTHDVQEPEP